MLEMLSYLKIVVNEFKVKEKYIALNQILNILSAQSSVSTFPGEDSLVHVTRAPLDSEEIAAVNQIMLSKLFAFQYFIPFQRWADGDL